MSEVLTTRVAGNIGIVEIASPPVNALSTAVRAAVIEGLRVHNADDAVAAIVILCAGRTFFAGADIAEFDHLPIKQPDFDALMTTAESSPKPVVAAIHGTALGGGFELALACNYRVAVPSAKVGFPEVHLGLLPGAGGTQRLPRLIGTGAALDLILSGKPVPAAKAAEMGVVDLLAEEGKLEETAIAFAQDVAAKGAPWPKVRDRAVAGGLDEIEAIKAKHKRQFKGFKAPGHIVQALEAAVTLPFEEGLRREQELFGELLISRESAAQRHVFFAQRLTAKVPDIGKDVPILPIRKVGVIGAGTMGGGITMNFLQAGVPVTLVEMKQEALDRGIATIRKNYERTAAKGRMTMEQVDKLMSLIDPVLSLDALADVDLVVEAVFEEISIKKDIFGQLDGICREGAILASNTSFLDLDDIASATSRPEWVVGMHFFSPANVMPLLEVVRGAKTGKEVIATVMKLAGTIRKTPVLAGVCHGFIANRIMEHLIVQSQQMVLEGVPLRTIDKVMNDYGFAMGPIAMLDLIGLDVLVHGASGRTLMGDFVAAGRRGQKTGKGFYDYDADRKATLSDEAAKIIGDFATYTGIAPDPGQSEENIRQRLLYPVVNEGAKCLEEGIALRASDIDVAAILGYNWPVFTGGPMFWGDTIGAATLLQGLKDLEGRYGSAFTPAALVQKLATEGGRFVNR
ncbi:3-hydroxyacyl-CoA dehydrogenase [Croceicoccus estronivorus]|uniref:3-hydroxyacyl-CoA dehydrogenase NAD-binding domain-containing protein n=1 Tax=Croceicoccus estronivorus TaxID=1172626 RepID=UPI00082CEE2A|nr:3-hydroxyacyl-CoA dehydrogenase NAD-binding domain-containing protein [Croceicoccus estronivorus]OCC23006.1 3-hydroxyacyl-CoA dehydrogenase [Croceicoccus estronivorus]